MPKFLEQRLRAEAAAKGFTGRHADAYVFGAMNNLGAMHGDQETAKGAAMDAKHSADVNAGRAKPLHPALKARAAAVKTAHAHLTKTRPGFRHLPGHEQIRHTQAHVRKTLKKAD